MFPFLQDIKRRLIERAPPDVFVLGNQKSGSTVIAASLAECAGASVSLDLHKIHTPHATAAYANNSLILRQIAQLCGWRFRATIVKEPILTAYMEDLLDTFPNSRFVFIVRDPRDNIRSILNRLQLPGDRSALSLEEQTRLPVVWREVIENRRLGFSFENYVESLAHRWLFLWKLNSLRTNQVVTVRYEDFSANKGAYIRGLTERLGLEVRVQDLQNIHKQYQGRGNRHVSWPVFFKRNLAVINLVCREAMGELGYSLQSSRAA